MIIIIIYTLASQSVHDKETAMNALKDTLAPQPQRSPRQLKTTQLFEEGDRTLIIVHAGMEYILRITRQGKLILTK